VLPISVRFRVRPPKPGKKRKGPSPIQVRLKIDRTTIVFAAVWKNEKLTVDPAKWNAAKRRSSERGCRLNDDLDALEETIKSINRQQSEQPKQPTAQSVFYQLEQQMPPVWTGGSVTPWEFPRWNANDPKAALSEESPLVDVVRAYILSVIEPSTIDRSSKHRWGRVPVLVEDFTRVRYGGKKTFTVRDVSMLWIEDFQAYLPTRRDDKRYPEKGMSEGHATRYARMVVACLEWMVKGRLLRRNEIASYKGPRNKTKEVYFLEPEHVETLLNTRYQGATEIARWWFCLMCLTGFDYPDAQDYVANRKAFEQMGKYGMKLVGRRRKGPNIEFDIPYLPELDDLFAQYIVPPRPIAHATLNKKTDTFESTISFERNITCKTARKTFGALMLYKGYRIQEVSRMMGHSSIRTTETFYVRVLGTTVDAGMKRVQGIEKL